MIELTIHFDVTSDKHLYQQIYEHIKNEIREGKLLQNERLPSTRALAEHLQVSRSTASNAYEQLESEGYIISRPYRGYFVCRYEELYHIESVKKERVLSNKQPVEESQYEVDFSPNGMEQNKFPFSTWSLVYRETLQKYNREIFALGDAQGEPELRETISRYLHASRGMECDASQIIIGAGNDYLLLLLDKIMRKKKNIAMEWISYNRAYQVLKSCGHKIRHVSTDTNGIHVGELNKSDANIVYVMPAHQFPLGIVMPIGRRLELLKWAAEASDRFIIEDDYDSEFRYKGKPIPALYASDRQDKVIYIGTFSKSIAPAIRISYMVLPKGLCHDYHEYAGFFASTVSRIDQHMLNDFIRRGFFERHLNKMRKCYKAKHDLVLEELRDLEPYFEISGENAGLHLLLKPREEHDVLQLKLQAMQKGVRVYPLAELSVSENTIQAGYEKTILLGYGGLSTEQIRKGIQTIKKAWTV